MTTWYTVDTSEVPDNERLMGAWPDAPLVDLETCDMILDVAREQVISYAREADLVEPSVQVASDLASLGYSAALIDDVLELLEAEPVAIPKRLVYAQLQQAKNLHNAGRVSSDGGDGFEGYSFTPRPLDKTIKAIIRPVDGKPHVL